MLEDLAEQGNELARRILDWRQLSKLKSTYTDALPALRSTRQPATSARLYAPGEDDTPGGSPVVGAEFAEHSGAQPKNAK